MKTSSPMRWRSSTVISSSKSDTDLAESPGSSAPRFTKRIVTGAAELARLQPLGSRSASSPGGLVARLDVFLTDSVHVDQVG